MSATFYYDSLQSDLPDFLLYSWYYQSFGANARPYVQPPGYLFYFLLLPSLNSFLTLGKFIKDIKVLYLVQILSTS